MYKHLFLWNDNVTNIARKTILTRFDNNFEKAIDQLQLIYPNAQIALHGYDVWKESYIRKGK